MTATPDPAEFPLTDAAVRGMIAARTFAAVGRKFPAVTATTPTENRLECQLTRRIPAPSSG